MATMTTVWIGMPTPSTRDGRTSETPSLPSVATSRAAQPGQARGVEAGRQAAGVPGAVLVRASASARCGPAARRPARTVQARPLLGRLEVLGEDGLAGLERVDAAQRGDVEQHAPGDDAGAQVVDAELGGAVGGHRLGRVAVVELPLVEDVAQRVDVAGGEAVRRDGEVVRPHALGDRARHVVRHRGGVVGRRHGVERRGRTTRSGPCAPWPRRRP